jgi:hypothetical protein
MTNPYSPPAQAGEPFEKCSKNPPGLFALLLASSSGAYIAMALGMTTCWLRGGWLDSQLRLPMERWRLPTYFWFHFGFWASITTWGENRVLTHSG